MADYSQQTWVDDDGTDTLGTVITKALMDHIEAGVKDAAEHNRIGPLSARPAAAAANKNWVWIATDTDGTGGLYHSDGSAWTKMLVGSLTANDTRFGTGGALSSPAADNAKLYSNYNPATDRLIDTSKAGWMIVAGAGGDAFSVYRAAATAGSPSWSFLTLNVDSSGNLFTAGPNPRFGSGGALNSFTQSYTILRSNYNGVTDRLVDTTRPSWTVELDGRSGFDRLTIERAPPTAGSPAHERIAAISADGVGQFFGDGSDGAGVADATVPTTLPGATRSGNTYTLTRDVYFTDLTVTASNIVTNGYRIFVKRNLSGNGFIIADGTNGGNAGAGVAGTGGSAAAAGSIAGSANASGGGGAGGAGAAAGSAPGGTVGLGSGGNGGNGGNGTGGANTGAAGSTPVAVPGGARRSAADMVFPIAWRFTGTVGAAMIGGGGSGGGGGGATGGGGGGGGGGAGVIVVAARYLTGSVSFTAKGGNGGNGAVNGGGGGGGGGGLIHLLYSSKQGQGGEGAWTGTATANGGNAGAGNGTGANGTAGAAGTVVQLPVI